MFGLDPAREQRGLDGARPSPFGERVSYRLFELRAEMIGVEKQDPSQDRDNPTRPAIAEQAMRSFCSLEISAWECSR
jgi:hypothetical protein